MSRQSLIQDSARAFTHPSLVRSFLDFNFTPSFPCHALALKVLHFAWGDFVCCLPSIRFPLDGVPATHDQYLATNARQPIPNNQQPTTSPQVMDTLPAELRLRIFRLVLRAEVSLVRRGETNWKAAPKKKYAASSCTSRDLSADSTCA